MHKTKIDYRKAIIEYLPFYLAVDDTGIYPIAVKGGKNPYEKRTEKMEGYNEAVMEITKKAGKISEFLEKHPHQTEIIDALLNDWIYLQADDEYIKLFVNCNDVFYWAMSESEEIKPEEIKDLRECAKLSKDYGAMLWACRKRGMRPQSPRFKDFSDEEKKLFEACGPERDPKDEG